ncbi:MAG: enoyl-CoA hydratase/isomerase family protein [Solirubrobacterales bacterium]|nr:enoyl-CoA hydratase/isomerase family protein [Solirubrobacterales bacterium]
MSVVRRYAGAELGEAAPGVALLTLSRPPVNALDAETYLGVADALDAAAGAPETRALVLTATGERAFSAGSDIGAFGDERDYERISVAGRRFFETLARLPVPVVGALNAPAVGGGAMIAAECDVLLAAPDAYFTIPELSLGVPGAGSHAKRLAPYFKVQRMLLLGERLTAEEALAFGTVLRIVARDELVAAAVGVAQEIAALDPDAVRAARAIFRAPESDAALAGYHAELDAAVRLVAARTGATRTTSS